MKKFILLFVIIVIGVLIFLFSNQAVKKEERKVDTVPSNDEQVSQPSSAVQTLVTNYVKENISQLSPEKEVLGGKFYVTKIIFTGINTAEVDYEDGHNAFRGRLTFGINEENEGVQISDFQLLPLK